MIIRLIHNLLKLFLFRDKNNKSEILILSLHKLGDTIFTIPSIKLINSIYGTEKVKILCYPHSEVIYKKVLKNDIVTISMSEFALGGRIAHLSAIKKFRKINPERIYDLTGNIKSASLLFFNTAKSVIGFNKNIYQSLYSEFKIRNNQIHLVHALLNIVDEKISAEQINKLVDVKLNKPHDGSILIHPFAGWSAKEWNINKFIVFALKLKTGLDKKIKFVFDSASGSEQFIEELKLKNIPFVVTNHIEELINEIESCFMLIGNDSGPIYIAAMLGKPTFSIYGPTNPNFSLPFGKHHGFIQKIIHCTPKKGEQYCYTSAGRDGCPSFECMNQLTVDEVYKNYKIHLSKLGI